MGHIPKSLLPTLCTMAALNPAFWACRTFSSNEQFPLKQSNLAVIAQFAACRSRHYAYLDMITTNRGTFVELTTGGGSMGWQAFDGFDITACARRPLIGNEAPKRAGSSLNSSIICNNRQFGDIFNLKKKKIN